MMLESLATQLSATISTEGRRDEQSKCTLMPIFPENLSIILPKVIKSTGPVESINTEMWKEMRRRDCCEQSLLLLSEFRGVNKISSRVVLMCNGGKVVRLHMKKQLIYIHPCASVCVCHFQELKICMASIAVLHPTGNRLV